MNNIFKIGALKGLEAQEIRVNFLNHRFLAFHLASVVPLQMLEVHICPWVFLGDIIPPPLLCFTTCEVLPSAFSPGLFCMRMSGIWALLCQAHIILSTSLFPSCLIHLVITKSLCEHASVQGQEKWFRIYQD